MLLNRLKCCFIILTVSSLLLQSCFIRKMRERASLCRNFEPATNKINFNCGEKKIIFLRISVSSLDKNIPGETYFEKHFDPAVNEITIPNLPDSIKKTREISLDLWISNQTIYDYSIIVEPKDWEAGKTLYLQTSYR